MRRRELKRELERLARDDADSGRAKLAKIESLRLLEKLDRQGDVGLPTDDEGRFHPSSDPRWWDLDHGDSDEIRQRWLQSWLADRLR